MAISRTQVAADPNGQRSIWSFTLTLPVIGSAATHSYLALVDPSGQGLFERLVLVAPEIALEFGGGYGQHVHKVLIV